MGHKVAEHEITKRVYQSVKKGVIFHEFPSGERLKIEELADKLRVSTTPVRETLNRLVAEGLIDMVPKVGFFMKKMWESEIRDLYELNQLLVVWSVSVAEQGNAGNTGMTPDMALRVEKLSQSDSPKPESLVKITSELFTHLAAHSGNSEISNRVRNINDRLHYIRLYEVRFCKREKTCNPVKELLSICQLYESGRYDRLKQALDTYHNVRLSLLQPVMKSLKFSSLDVDEFFSI